MTQHNFLHRAVRNWPPKTPAIQFLRTHPKSAAVIYDQLKAIAPRICEEKGMAARRVAFQPVAHQTVKTVESLPQISGARGHVDPRGRPKSKHGYTRSNMVNRRSNVPASNPQCTSIRRPPRDPTISTLARMELFEA